ncbi:N-acetylglucosamine-6-phosphate deacetylase [Nocardia salmonicida]|uniref:N-acetylglucosamine-6-phosphate deacetylase n=1 Tax=Nocardia salmonicida TaxID=53431 RepID=UPI000B2EA170|nr:amidohydrolase family protein [Nocardia salmonicida]MBC7299771.1 amidohydrolase family protein [Nocardia sp.]
MRPPGCLIVRSSNLVLADPTHTAQGQIAVCEGTVTADPTGCGHHPRVLEANEKLVGPGLVDLHLHGALGHDFTEPDPAAWRHILDTHLRAGTTTALATLASTTAQATAAALATAADLLTDDDATTLAGVHLEGPCLAADQRGAHDLAHLRSPAKLLAELTPVPTALQMVTLAPELPEADTVISYLVDHGVRVSVGHSQATPAQLQTARNRGATHLAHLWSGQSALTRPGVHRMPGLLEASLASDEFTAELIADGHHLPAELLTIALRCLGPERLCLVSDATAGMGLPTGYTFRTGAATGRVHDGYATTTTANSLCGSIVALSSTLARMRALTGASVREVLTMATATPAKVLGRYPRIGTLRPGARANLTLWDADLTLASVVLDGRLVADDADGPR